MKQTTQFLVAALISLSALTVACGNKVTVDDLGNPITVTLPTDPAQGDPPPSGQYLWVEFDWPLGSKIEHPCKKESYMTLKQVRDTIFACDMCGAPNQPSRAMIEELPGSYIIVAQGGSRHLHGCDAQIKFVKYPSKFSLGVRGQ